MGEKGERLHHRRRRPNSVMQRLAPSSSLKNSGATKWLYLLPSARLDRGQEPLFLAHRRTVGPDWMARTYTQVRPEELAGKLAHRGARPPSPCDMAGYDDADCDKCWQRKIFRTEPRNGFATERPGWVGGGGGGINLRGGALTALAPSQVQSKDRENVENVLLFIFFSTFAAWETFSIVDWQTSELYLTATFSILFFTLYSLHAQSCQVLPHQHLTAMLRDVTNKISKSSI